MILCKQNCTDLRENMLEQKNLIITSLNGIDSSKVPNVNKITIYCKTSYSILQTQMYTFKKVLSNILLFI